MKAKAAAAFRVVLLFALAVMAWRALNYDSNAEPGPDSSIFMSTGWHALNGRVLYRDELAGPPMIYALNAIVLAISDDGINAVRVMERGFAVVGAAAFFVAVFLGFGRFWLAWITSVLYLMHLFGQNVIEGGNVTEEYGGVFLLLGIAGVIAATRWTRRKRFVLGAFAGLAFSLAVLSKEPFVLIVPPWFAYFAWPRNRDWADAKLRALAFITGVAVAGAAFVGFLVVNGAWTAWLESISTSLAYTALAPAPEVPLVVLLLQRVSEKVSPMLIASLAATLGVAALFRRRTQQNRDGLPMAIVASTVMSLWAVTIGGRYYGHYFMFFVGSFTLLCASGIAFAASLVSSNRRATVAAIIAAMALLVFDRADVKEFLTNLAMPARRWNGNWLGETVRRNTTAEDPIWTPWKPLLYVETRRVAPTRWQSVFDIYFVDTPASTREEKLRRLRAELEASPPTVIVISPLPGSGPTRLSADLFLAGSHLTKWVATNYHSVMCTSAGNADVLFRNGSLGMAHLTPLTNDSAAMWVGTAALYEQDDLIQAEACFRKVLARTPNHYGATFQLATTLDLLKKTSEATVRWREVVALARKFGDERTEARALARLK